MPQPHREGDNKRCFCPSVCLSVHLSIAYIANNLRTKRPSIPKFGSKVSTFDATRIPVSRSKGEKSRSPRSLMLTHIVCHILRTAKPTNFKFGIRLEDDDPHQPQAPWPLRSKVKVASHVISLSRLGPMLYLCHLEASGPCRPNPAATLLICILFIYLLAETHAAAGTLCCWLQVS